MTIRFIADSAADLPKDFVEKNNIDVFPLYIHHDNEIYKDGIDLEAKELYKRMKNGEMFKTSQVSVNVFLEKFKEYAKKEEKVIYLALSSKLSGTFQSAVLAKKEIKEK
ncbi:MAG: DegV family protein, partial [Bacillota bacterium]